MFNQFDWGGKQFWWQLNYCLLRRIMDNCSVGRFIGQQMADKRNEANKLKLCREKSNDYHVYGFLEVTLALFPIIIIHSIGSIDALHSSNYP